MFFEKERLDELRKKIRQDTAQVLKSGLHIGLTNVHARIRLRSQNERHGVTITSSPEAVRKITGRPRLRA